MMRQKPRFYQPDALIAAAAVRKSRRGRTRSSLAQELQVAELTLRSVLNGHCPNLKSIKKVATKLGCKVDVQVSRINEF
jgi:lambda repressor-like predicted transcriptional regulator